MKTLILLPIILCLLGINALLWAESYEGIPLLKPEINPQDLPSLQRGAKIYINYCSGCHTLKFMRYNRMAKDLGILNPDGQIAEQLVKDSFIFTGARISDTIQIAMNNEDAKGWFGVAPPDLSVITRARGVDWVYTYVLGFYQDNTRPWGVNNLVFNDTAMPDVLVNLRGKQIPIYETRTIVVEGIPQTVKAIKHLVLVEQGAMLPSQFNGAMTDLVNFLAYVAEPNKNKREQLGWWVIGYLVIFAGLAYLLKRAYWKNIK